MTEWLPAQRIKGLTFPPVPQVAQPPASASSADDSLLGFLGDLRSTPANRRHTRTGSRTYQQYVTIGSIVGVVLLVGAFLVYHSLNSQKPVSVASESTAKKSVSDIPTQSSARLPKTVKVPSRSAVPLDLPAIPDVGRMTRAIQEESNRFRQRPPTIPQQNNQPTSTGTTSSHRQEQVSKAGKGAAKYRVTAMELSREYLTDADAADRKYKGQILEITGTSRLSGAQPNGETGIVHYEVLKSAEPQVRCLFENEVEADEISNIGIGHPVVIEGRCEGLVVIQKSYVVLRGCRLLGSATAQRPSQESGRDEGDSLGISAGGQSTKPVSKDVEPSKQPTAGPLVASLQHNGGVRSIDFSPKGNRLFIVAGENNCKLWDVSTWREIPASSSDCNYFSAPAVFSPDGKMLACQDGSVIRIWNIEAPTASLMTSLPAWAPNGDDHSWNEIVWCQDGTLFARNPKGGVQFFRQDDKQGAVLLKSIGSGIYGCYSEADTITRKVMYGKTRQSGEASAYRVGKIVVARNGKAWGTLDSKEEVVDIRTGGSVKKIGLRVWEIPSGKHMGIRWFDLPGVGGDWSCDDVLLSSDASNLVASCHRRPTDMNGLDELYLVKALTAGKKGDSTDFSSTDLFPGSAGKCLDLRCRAVSPDGKSLAISAVYGLQTSRGVTLKRFIAVCDVVSGKALKQFEPTHIGQVFFGQDGTTLVAGGAEKGFGTFAEGDPENDTQNVIVWSVATGKQTFRIADQGILAIALSPDGTLLATGHSDGELRVRKLPAQVAGQKASKTPPNPVESTSPASPVVPAIPDTTTP